MGRKYRHSPIVEAICEFRFLPDPAWDQTRLRQVADQVRLDYPEESQDDEIDARVTVKPTGLEYKTIKRGRIRLSCKEKRMLVIIGHNLLSISHLPPYTTWENFLPSIEKVLSIYSQAFRPNGFQRIGLRYVNRISFGQDPVSLDQYLDFYPFVGSRVPQEHQSVNMSIEAPFESGRDVLRLSLATPQADKGSGVSVLLDLDYFLGQQGGVGIGGELEWLNLAHQHVEDVFEGCIKDPLRQRFDQPEKP